MNDQSVTVEDRADESQIAETGSRLESVGPALTLGELSTLRGTAPVDVIEARVQIVETLRRASIRATHPEDWVLYKAGDEHGGQVVAYLQDAGCDRVRDLWGIEIYGLGKPEKISGDEPGTFHYVITGNGRCRITKQVVEAMEGGRSSSDDFCRDRRGAELELVVRKSARANLDGNITRELAGLKSVPLDELERAWNGTAKKTDRCRLGRGFGSRAERLGATTFAPDVEPPVCGVCGKVGRYYAATRNRGAFYGCPDYQTHPQRKWSQDAEKWIAAQRPIVREPGQDG